MSSTKLLIEKILRRSDAYDWSIQGLGMLRLYLSPALRLHVWDQRYRITNVSPIHDHPWAFESEVVAGAVRQVRYIPGLSRDLGGFTLTFKYATIKCGEGAHTLSEPQTIHLQPMYEEFREGEKYMQKADEIHESQPEDGTVTLCLRTFGQNRDNARVFWRGDGDFVSAEPRPATPDEVAQITQNALTRWF